MVEFGDSLDHAEYDTLVLRRREFVLREHVERNHQHRDDRPQRQDYRPVTAAYRSELARNVGVRCRSGD